MDQRPLTDVDVTNVDVTNVDVTNVDVTNVDVTNVNVTNVVDLPRLVIAGTSSGVGKTTVTVGLCRALRARGLKVALFKCGPDYLDPTYHQRAAGAPSHNLDGWMMGRDAALTTFTYAARAAGADIALIEGVMGLFDGASPTGDQGSTAEMAKWLGAPVVLVVDASGMARSLAALVAGFTTFDRQLRVAGVICNRVGSRGHLELLAQAQRTPPVVGGLTEATALAFPERHLGLRTAHPDAVPEALFEAWGSRVAESLDIDLIVQIARSAAAIALPDDAARPAIDQARCRIGLAFDEAFHFYYDDNLRRLEALGAQLVRFSPLHDAALPEVDGLYLGGGYPEVHAEALAANRSMRADILAFAARRRPVYAECGGLMYLSQAISTLDGRSFEMVGLIPAQAVMAGKLEALGYVEVELQEQTPLGPPGTRFRGHQFRYSRLTEPSSPVALAYSVRRRRGQEVFREGYHIENVVASYVHAHWASNPLVAQAFVSSCADGAGRDLASSRP
jgi:cobyrinic acid a,c-diamide synthase